MAAPNLRKISDCLHLLEELEVLKESQASPAFKARLSDLENKAKKALGLDNKAASSSMAPATTQSVAHPDSQSL